MEELINFCFNGSDKEFNGIAGYCTIWDNSRKNHRLGFNKTSLKLAINDYWTNIILLCAFVN